MDQEALLKIVIRDVKELETLLSSFTNQGFIPEPFMRLARSKASGIVDEIEMLYQLRKTVAAGSMNQHKAVVSDEITGEEPRGAVIEDKVSAAPVAGIVKPERLPPPGELSATTVVNMPIQPHGGEPSAPTRVENLLPVAGVVKPERLPPPGEFSAPAAVNKPVEPTGGGASAPTRVEKAAPVVANGKNQVILAEVLGSNKPSFNEMLAQSKGKDKMPGVSKPVKDLTKAIGINDRFLFQRELFNDNAELFSQTIAQVNNMDSLAAAESFISANFSWDQNNETVIAFKQLMSRRFI